jgi:hypothetical protein
MKGNKRKSAQLKTREGKTEAILRRGVAKRDEVDDSDSTSTSTRHMLITFEHSFSTNQRKRIKSQNP